MKTHIPNPDGDGLLCGSDSLAAHLVTNENLCVRCLRANEKRALLVEVRGALQDVIDELAVLTTADKARFEALIARVDAALPEQLRRPEKTAPDQIEDQGGTGS